jgi:hypothetical protein
LDGNFGLDDDKYSIAAGSFANERRVGGTLFIGDEERAKSHSCRVGGFEKFSSPMFPRRSWTLSWRRPYLRGESTDARRLVSHP